MAVESDVTTYMLEKGAVNSLPSFGPTAIKVGISSMWVLRYSCMNIWIRRDSPFVIVARRAENDAL